jgi:hypothetical protein
VIQGAENARQLSETEDQIILVWDLHTILA